MKTSFIDTMGRGWEEDCSKSEPKKTAYSEGAVDLPSTHPFPVCSDLLFRLLKTSENIGLTVLSNSGQTQVSEGKVRNGMRRIVRGVLKCKWWWSPENNGYQ